MYYTTIFKRKSKTVYYFITALQENRDVFSFAVVHFQVKRTAPVRPAVPGVPAPELAPGPPLATGGERFGDVIPPQIQTPPSPPVFPVDPAGPPPQDPPAPFAPHVAPTPLPPSWPPPKENKETGPVVDIGLV